MGDEFHLKRQSDFDYLSQIPILTTKIENIQDSVNELKKLINPKIEKYDKMLMEVIFI